jgi:predicted nucleotidyltransferase component of viral defense system
MTKSNIAKMIEHYQNSKIQEQTKIREILQQAALLGLERTGIFEKAAFYGGTALRILYGLDRFSEDLDFTLLKPDSTFDFTPFLEGMKRELSSFGFEMEVIQKKKNTETSVHSAFLKINTIELYLAIGNEKRGKAANHNEKVQIKIEIDTDPPPHARVQNRLVLNPTSFYVLTLNQNDLFAGKMHAALYRAWKGRVKGRDWYDIIWYITNKIPLSLTYLEACMRQANNLKPDELLDRKKLLERLHEKIGSIDWESAKVDMRPFISDPARLDIWSPEYFQEAMTHLEVEKR